MNGLDEILAETLKVADKNKDIIIEIKNKSKILLLEDIFDIAKIFFFKQKPDLPDFTINDFMEQDPDGYFAKIIKGFCVGLEYIIQNELTAADKQTVLHILKRREKITNFIDETVKPNGDKNHHN